MRKELHMVYLYQSYTATQVGCFSNVFNDIIPACFYPVRKLSSAKKHATHFMVCRISSELNSLMCFRVWRILLFILLLLAVQIPTMTLPMSPILINGPLPPASAWANQRCRSLNIITILSRPSRRMCSINSSITLTSTYEVGAGGGWGVVGRTHINKQVRGASQQHFRRQRWGLKGGCLPNDSNSNQYHNVVNTIFK